MFVVPGNIDVASCAGSNALLREGAIAVSHGWDILSEYETLYPGKIRRETKASRQRVYADELPDASTESDKTLPKVAQKALLPRVKPDKKEKSYKLGVDNTSQPNYSDVNKKLSALSPEQQAIVSCLSGGERLVDQIIGETGLSAGKVSSLLTMLVIRGIVKKLPGNRVCLK
mgnify:FL=1